MLSQKIQNKLSQKVQRKPLPPTSSSLLPPSTLNAAEFDSEDEALLDSNATVVSRSTSSTSSASSSDSSTIEAASSSASSSSLEPLPPPPSVVIKRVRFDRTVASPPPSPLFIGDHIDDAAAVKKAADALAAADAPFASTSLSHQVPEFLCHLYTMLRDPSLSNLLTWAVPLENESDERGGGLANIGKIIVHDPAGLQEEVLGNYYRHSKYASFQRQLNYFGFKKRLHGGKKGKFNPCSYVHDKLGNDPRSLFALKRRPPSRNRSRAIATIGSAISSTPVVGTSNGVLSRAAVQPKASSPNTPLLKKRATDVAGECGPLRAKKFKREEGPSELLSPPLASPEWRAPRVEEKKIGNRIVLPDSTGSSPLSTTVPSSSAIAKPPAVADVREDKEDVERITVELMAPIMTTQSTHATRPPQVKVEVQCGAPTTLFSPTVDYPLPHPNVSSASTAVSTTIVNFSSIVTPTIVASAAGGKVLIAPHTAVDGDKEFGQRVDSFDGINSAVVEAAEDMTSARADAAVREARRSIERAYRKNGGRSALSLRLLKDVVSSDQDEGAPASAAMSTLMSAFHPSSPPAPVPMSGHTDKPRPSTPVLTAAPRSAKFQTPMLQSTPRQLGRRQLSPIAATSQRDYSMASFAPPPHVVINPIVPQTTLVPNPLQFAAQLPAAPTFLLPRTATTATSYHRALMPHSRRPTMMHQPQHPAEAAARVVEIESDPSLMRILGTSLPPAGELFNDETELDLLFRRHREGRHTDGDPMDCIGDDGYLYNTMSRSNSLVNLALIY